MYLQLTRITLSSGKPQDILEQDVVSLAREKYEQLYQEEMEINATFNQFVRNYKTAYEGENTRRDQIIDARKKKSVSRKQGKLSLHTVHRQ